MAEKPTYEELERRVKELEKQKKEWLTHKTKSRMDFEIHIPEVDLGDIINAAEIQSIMEDFGCLTNMATAIVDLEGKVIEATGWQDICTKFHRIHPRTAFHCTKSDLFLVKNLKPGEYVDYKCENGLWDVVTPLYIGTQHLGNIYTGQFFYDDEQVDEKLFIKQAEEYGFEKESYLEAFRRIPRYSRETIKHLMSFLVKFSTYISRISFLNIKLEKEIRGRSQAAEALKDSESYLRTLLRTIPDLIWLKDREGRYLFCNAKIEKLFGASEKDILGKTDYDLVDKELADFFRMQDENAMAKKVPVRNEEVVTFADDGHREILETIKTPMNNCYGQFVGVLGIGRDITERKRVEQALKESEEKFRNFADQSFVGINLIQDGIFKYVNPKFAEIFGYTVEQCLGNMSFHQLVYPEDLHVVRENISKRISGEIKTVHYRFRGVRKNSEIVYLEIFGNSTLFDGKPAVIGTILDITERIQTEKALQHSESTLNLLLETVPIPVFYKDKEGRYLRINKAFEVLSGKTRQQLIGKTAFDISPSEMAKSHHVRDEKLFENGDIQIYDAQVQDGNGVLHDVISYKAPIADVHGLISGLVGVFLDITDRKQAEENLRQYERIVSSTEDMLALLDENFVYLAVNAEYLKAFGKTSPEMIGKTAEEVFGKELFQTAIRPRAERCLAGETTHYQNWFEFPGKGRIYIDAAYSPYVGTDNRVQGIVFTARDITEYQKLQAQLLQAQKMESVGRLAGGVAHDYNNMLSIIMGYGELAKEKVAPGGPLHADLTEILSAAKRSVDITRQLLAFSRQQTIDPKVLDINDTIESMLKMLRRLIGEDIDLAWLPETNVWQVKIDPSQVDQILANLCVNARDAIVDVGKVTIETQNMHLDESYCADNAGAVPGEHIMLAVSDNGCGIAPEAMDKVFEPFYTTKGVGKGTGLGLATVYGIVKQNNGFIKAYSESGEGTTIKVYLPRHMGSTDQAPRKDSLKIPLGGGETILLVEDDVPILKLSQKLLEHLGYQVLSAASPAEAIRRAVEYKGKIDLLMTDVVMPEMNGRELSDHLQSIFPDLYVLFMSGYTANAIAHRGVLEKGMNFIQKPFSQKDLAIKLRKMLDQSKYPDQLL